MPQHTHAHPTSSQRVHHYLNAAMGDVLWCGGGVLGGQASNPKLPDTMEFNALPAGLPRDNWESPGELQLYSLTGPAKPRPTLCCSRLLLVHTPWVACWPVNPPLHSSLRALFVS